MPSLKFQRNKEDFICQHCDTKVVGDGYTNHCPKCLWSKHVDVNPGDRMSYCHGMMKPTWIETKKGSEILVHKCITCNHEKKNGVQKDDDFDAVIELAKATSDMK